jgi:hypothetical protein
MNWIAFLIKLQGRPDDPENDPDADQSISAADIPHDRSVMPFLSIVFEICL